MGISDAHQGRDSVKLEKRLLRQTLLHQRQQISPQDYHVKCTSLCHRLSDWRQREGASYRTICAFFSHKGEPDLGLFFAALPYSCELCLPVVVEEAQNQMFFSPWRPGEDLKKNRYGIEEPTGRKSIELSDQTLMLIPAVAVSSQGLRLGMGGGFYDAFLARHPHVMKIAIVFDEFVMSALPTEDYDQKVNGYCTDQRLAVF